MSGETSHLVVGATRCVACGGGDLFNVLALGEQAPVNNLRDTAELAEAEPRFPLGMNACRDCGHGQLTHNVDPSVMFTDYAYVSGTSRTMMEHFDRLADGVARISGVHGRVLEIGSNDGTFLDRLRERDVVCAGVDPAANLQGDVRARGHKAFTGFWPEVADEVTPGTVDLVIGQNVFAHTPDPLGWLEACVRVLRPDGLVMVQTSQADMVANGEFDTVYHEHYSFYNEHSLSRLAERAGLRLLFTVYPAIHGTSSLYVLGRAKMVGDGWTAPVVARLRGIMSDALGDDQPPPTERHRALREERRSEQAWAEFGYEAIRAMTELSARWTEWLLAGRRVIAAGVAAKGVTMLRASGVNPDALVDEAPLKIGKHVPGLSAPVQALDSAAMRESGPSAVFIMTAWNFKREIARKLIAAGASPDAVGVTYFPLLETAPLGEIAE